MDLILKSHKSRCLFKMSNVIFVITESRELKSTALPAVRALILSS